MVSDAAFMPWLVRVQVTKASAQRGGLK